MIFLGAALLCTLRADIEFVGILVTPQITRFALGDTATGHTAWVARGHTFAGYLVAAYDAKADVITLTRDGTELHLHLKDDAKIQAARLELTGAITFGANEKIEIERATLLFDQENVFPLKDGITYRITPTRRPDKNIIYRISIERALSDNKTETIAAPAITAQPGQPFSLQFGELGFAFTPR